MRRRELRALTFAVLGVAAAWGLIELIAAARLATYVVFGTLWAIGVILGVALTRGRGVAWDRSSPAFLGAAFFGNRLLFLGVDVLAMTAFLAVLLFLAVVQRFNRAFGDVYSAVRGDAPLLRDVDRALSHGLLRALGAIALGFALTLVVANVTFFAGTPFTTPLSALILTLLLILVVARLVRNPSVAREPPR